MQPFSDPVTARPVITGLGVVTHRGSGIDAAWEALTGGAPAGRDWQPEAEGESFFAAPVPDDYTPHPHIPRNLSHLLDRGSLIALDAALQAVESAGLGAGAGDSRRFAVADGLAYRAPGQATIYIPYGHLIARGLGVRGQVAVVGGAEASGMAAIAAGARLVASGKAEVVIAGAAQALQLPLVEHLRAQGFASKSAPRPFDAQHNGFVAAEGAAYVVIEHERHAEERGQAALARIAGLSEIFDPSTEPLETSGAAERGRALQAALADAGFLQNQVDLVVSCADGRPPVDAGEATALVRTFGRHAHYATVTSVAGALGHALAASGPLSVVFAVEAMRRQEVFPIAGFAAAGDGPELACAKEARPERLDCVLVTSTGLGGTIASLVLERVPSGG